MKFAIGILFSLFLIASCDRHGAKETKYEGVIISKGYEGPASGYKTSLEPCYYVMMRENRKGIVMRINLTIPAWYSLDSGSKASFVLNNWQMCDYGNIQNYSHNLYGE